MTRPKDNKQRARRFSPLSLAAAPLTMLLAAQPAAAGTADASAALARLAGLLPFMQSAATPNRVDGLTVEELDDGTTVLRLAGSAKPTFNVYRLQDPERLVVDIAGSERGKVVPHVPLDTWACGRVTVDGVAERDAKLVRVVVELRREASSSVVPDGTELVVTVTPREVAPEAYFARKSAGKRRAEIEADKREASKLRSDAAKLNTKASKQARAAEEQARLAS